MQPAPHTNGTPMDFKFAQYACDLRVWDRWNHPCPPQGRGRVQNTCTCTARALCTLGPFFIQRQVGLAKVHPCTEFGVASLKFTFTGGPHVKTASSPLARAAGTPQERHPQWILSWCSTRLTCEFGLSDSHRLTSRGAQKFLVEPPSFRRFGASIGATPVPIGPAVRALGPEMLRHTHTLTNTIRPTFFRRPTMHHKTASHVPTDSTR